MMKPMNPNAITYIVMRYARKAGILKKISPHSCPRYLYLECAGPARDPPVASSTWRAGRRPS